MKYERRNVNVQELILSIIIMEKRKVVCGHCSGSNTSLADKATCKIQISNNTTVQRIPRTLFQEVQRNATRTSPMYKNTDWTSPNTLQPRRTGKKKLYGKCGYTMEEWPIRLEVHTLVWQNDPQSGPKTPITRNNRVFSFFFLFFFSLLKP